MTTSDPTAQQALGCLKELAGQPNAESQCDDRHGFGDEQDLGVYTGLSAGVLSGFLGASTNTFAIGSAVAGDLATWNFSGIQVTVDSTVGAGSGLLYFVYQDVNTATTLGGDAVDFPTRRFENAVTDPTFAMANTLSNIIAFGTLQAGRAPEYQASLTRIPEPATITLVGLCGIALLGVRRARCERALNR